MANIKFSAFTQKVALGDVDFLVGYTGADNVRVAPSVFSGIYLPLAGGTMTGAGGVVAPDNFKWNFGTGSDLQIFHNATDSIVYNGTGALMLRGADIRMQASDGGETMATFTDNGAVDLYYDNVKKFETEAGGVLIPSGDYLSWGTSGVTSIEGSTVSNKIAFRTDSTERMRIDSVGNVGIGTITPVTKLHVSSADNQLARFESTDAYGGIEICDNTSGAAKPLISALGNAFIFYNGGGSHTEAMRIISSGNVGIGTATPASILHLASAAATVFRVEETTNNATAAMYATATDLWMGAITNHPLKILTNDVTAITIDTSQDATFAGSIHLADSKYVYWGGSNDFYIGHAVTETNMINSTGNLNIEQHANDADIVFKCDDGAGGTETYLTLDGGDQRIKIPDAKIMQFGAGGDLQIQHDAVNSLIRNYTGDLIFTNYDNDKDIIFQSDDGAGGIATYFRVDGGEVETRFFKSTLHFDNVKAKFGDGGDLEIYHDGSNSYISDTGTGNLFIQASSSLNLRSSSGEWYMDGIANGAVNLYYDNVLKIETTSTGTKTTGQMDIAALNTAPASAGAAGVLGEIRYTADYIYVCTATNTWKRTAISTW